MSTLTTVAESKVEQCAGEKTLLVYECELGMLECPEEHIEPSCLGVLNGGRVVIIHLLFTQFLSFNHQTKTESVQKKILIRFILSSYESLKV